jgi:hypothetical protein
VRTYLLSSAPQHRVEPLQVAHEGRALSHLPRVERFLQLVIALSHRLDKLVHEIDRRRVHLPPGSHVLVKSRLARHDFICQVLSGLQLDATNRSSQLDGVFELSGGRCVLGHAYPRLTQGAVHLITDASVERAKRPADRLFEQVLLVIGSPVKIIDRNQAIAPLQVP